MTHKSFLLSAALLFAAASALEARITLPSVISDNMVLQQKTDAALWGKAEPGAKVTVKVGWSKKKVVTTADRETGKWLVRVATPEAGGPWDITISDGDALTLTNVLVGEVWFASGQSNMEMPVMGYTSQPAKGGMDFIVTAKPSRPIRICKIKRASSTTVADTTVGSWKTHNPESVGDVSAVAYFFAEALQSVIDIPVGIIVSSWGGSSIQTWMCREVIEKEFPEFDLGHLDGTRAAKNKHQEPALLWNGQVAPLVPYTFKGMIWYQGETNRGNPEQYIRLQEAYVRMMREKFCVPDAPFYFVQIAPYQYNHPDGWTSGYFVEAQRKSLEVIPHSGMAVTSDIGEYGTIHPCEKRPVGQRLAYLALHNDYGYKSIEADSPTFKSVEFKNEVRKDGSLGLKKAYVRFKVGNLGLSPMGRQIEGFEIAGDDKVFQPAEARLNKDRSVIEVWSEDVPEPVAVRYCFRNWCVGGLFNNFGIPAAPFRTDDWDL